ncbi:glycoside hydrolase family 3 protein [Paenibacillus swuensis]|uniref:glycoside hydrolase family 3 protein n=1 Tax=Paenibacillus swuensis TaxID=1178515 RepID=UPI0008382507|nr:glycoside hydrolase family 3 N-terminal domain-containing protein [Paenibacillus swuensis]
MTSTSISYMDRTLTASERATQLLALMNIKEKIAQMQCVFLQELMDENGDLSKKHLISEHGLGGIAFERIMMPHSLEKEVEIVNGVLRHCKENTRLGIPPFISAEALHGLCLKGATSFPQAIGLAAMWNPELMEEVSGVIAAESKARGIRQVLSPTIDMARDLRWGRVEETYGEDPVLTSKTAVSFCRSLESAGIVTTPKHFVANSGDGGRDSGPVYHSERVLKSLYFVPYQACIEEAGVRSVMASYNALDSIPVGLNKWLLTDMLKGYLGFKGFVVTDYGLMHKAKTLHRVEDNDYARIAARAVKAGLHREIPSFLGENGYSSLEEALDRGLLVEEDIDALVVDILRVKFERGLFDEELSLDFKETEAVTACAKHGEVAYRAATKSIVMLKNDNVLPLVKGGKVAIMGSLAKAPKLGGYSTWGIEVPSLADVMEEAEVVEPAAGQGQSYSVIPQKVFSCITDQGIEQGLYGYFKPDKTYCGQPVVKRTDAELHFDWSDGPVAQHAQFPAGGEFSAEWKGFIEAPASGQFSFCMEANGGISLSIDGEMLIDRFHDTVSDCQYACYDLEKGKKYPISVMFGTSGTSPRLKLTWDYQPDRVQPRTDYASLLEGYETVIVTAGLTEGEGSDRANLDLTQSVEKLITDVADLGKQVIVVLYGGSAVTMQHWVSKAGAILHVWYPGQAGSSAIADILYGAVNPAGRLPITFPQHVAQLPMCYNTEPRGRNSGYNDMPDKPLFPFGFGLSYTTFEYGTPKLSKTTVDKDEETTLSIEVRNTGGVDGDEVVQLYIRDLYGTVATPLFSLKDYKRVTVEAGECVHVTFTITPRMLRLLDESLNWIVEPGDFELMLGSSSADIRQTVRLTVV